MRQEYDDNEVTVLVPRISWSTGWMGDGGLVFDGLGEVGVAELQKNREV